MLKKITNDDKGELKYLLITRYMYKNRSDKKEDEKESNDETKKLLINIDATIGR